MSAEATIALCVVDAVLVALIVLRDQRARRQRSDVQPPEAQHSHSA